jgi:hypothetical protein
MFTGEFVVSNLSDLFGRMDQSPRLRGGGDPIGEWAHGIVKMMWVVLLTASAAVVGGVAGWRLSRMSEFTIPTDNLRGRLMIVVHFGLLWFSLYEGYERMVRGPAPPDRHLGLLLGGGSLLWGFGLFWRSRLTEYALYLAGTGLLLIALTFRGVEIANGDHIEKIHQAILLLALVIAAGLWGGRILSRPLRPPASQELQMMP